MGFNFPNAPTDGQQFTPAGGPIYVFSAAGNVWKIAPSTAASIAFSPVGGIAATNVQAALQELDSEKVSEAPNDGQQYARQSLGWSVVTGGGGGGGAASSITFTPSGNIAASNVQLALQEVDNEKLALAGGVMTGQITLPATVAGAALAVRRDYVDTVASGKEGTITAGTSSQYYRGDKTFQTLDKTAVGLANVDNTSDVNKPVSTAQATAIALKADIASPTFTGDPKAPTPTAGDNDTSIATTAFVTAAVLAAGGGAVYSKTANASFTRGAGTGAYATGQALSGSSASVLTFSNVVNASGKSCEIEGLIVTSSAAMTLLMQGELWLFDTSPTAIADQAAFTLTDAEILTVVGKIPFTIDSTGNATAGAGGNAMCEVEVDKLVTTVGSANLFGLVKVINAYSPVASEVVTFRLKTRQTD